MKTIQWNFTNYGIILTPGPYEGMLVSVSSEEEGDGSSRFQSKIFLPNIGWNNFYYSIPDVSSIAQAKLFIERMININDRDWIDMEEEYLEKMEHVDSDQAMDEQIIEDRRSESY